MCGQGSDLLAGYGEGDVEVGEGCEGEGDGVGDGDGAGWDGYGGVAVEGQVYGGVGLNCAGSGVSGGEGYSGAVDDEGVGALFVGEDYAEGGAADGDVD